MKAFKYLINSWAAFFLCFLIVSCEDDSIDPAVEGIEIVNEDLLQVTDAAPYVTVSFSARSSELNTVAVQITPVGSSSAVYSNTLKNITSDQLNRVSLNVPFPTPDVAPSGDYVVSIALNGASSGSSVTSYEVKILNNRTIKYCDFPNAPAGKVGVFVTVPGGDAVAAAGKDIYIVGNFMVKNGAAGDWNPGNPDFKLTKISNQCYYIFLDKFDKDDAFKLTLGDWPFEFLGAKGEGLPDQKAPGGNVNITAYNFKTLPVTQYDVPEVLPATAVKSNHNTIVVNVNRADDQDGESKYYLVAEGATSLTGAIELVRMTGSTKLSAAVPRVAGAKYLVVKDEIGKVGINNFDVGRVITVDPAINPMQVNIPGFRTELSVTPVPANLFMVGEATPGGWNNPVPVPSQQFTKSGNVFTLTLNLQGDKEYLFLPVNGSWDAKFGMGGTPITGDLIPQGNNFKAPMESGTYLVTADFNAGTYTLQKQ